MIPSRRQRQALDNHNAATIVVLMTLPRLTLDEEFQARQLAAKLGYTLKYVRDFMRRDKKKRASA